MEVTVSQGIVTEYPQQQEQQTEGVYPITEGLQIPTGTKLQDRHLPPPPERYVLNLKATFVSLWMFFL